MRPLLIAVLSALCFVPAGAQDHQETHEAGPAGTGAANGGAQPAGDSHAPGPPEAAAGKAKDQSPDPARVMETVQDLVRQLHQAPAEKREEITSAVFQDHDLTPKERELVLAGLQTWAREHVPTGDSGNTMADTPEGRRLQSQPGTGVIATINNQRKRERPRDPEVFIGSGRDAFAAGNFRASYSDYHHALELGSTTPAVYLGYGNAAYRLGDYAVATQAAKVVLAADPGNKEALSLYHASKDRVPAVTLPSIFGELAEDRSSGAAPSGGSDANSEASQPVAAPPPSGMTVEQAAAYAQQAAAAGPDGAARSRQFSKDAEGALGVKDYSSAYQLATQAVQLNPKNAQALNYRAIALSRQGQYAEAAQDASAALALAPGNAAALLTRSEALSRQGKYSDALQDAEAVLSANPKNAYAWQGKAFALAGLRQNPGVLDSLRRSADLDPRFSARLERAVQLPEDADMRLLFEDGAAPAPRSPGSRPGRFLRLFALTAIGGLLIALGTLHVVSSSWRDKVTATARRVLGAGVKTGVASAQPGGAFWTQYELVKEIGFGGMGVVYEAKDRSLERRVAVKRMRDEIRLDPQERRRFVNEARLVAQLHHANIVDIYGIVEDGADVYLVFEYVPGRTLEDALKSDGPMEFRKARRVLKEMAAAIAHAHERGVIHRDLKPSNVMIASEGHVKVMDFGVARQAKDALTRHSMTNTIVGTPPYMAPEQEQGTVRKESDVYALGVCLYELLTGQLPFKGSGAAMLLSKLNGRLTPASQRVSSLPPGIDAVIAKALSPEPDQRYRTPGEFIAALEGLSSTVRAA